VWLRHTGGRRARSACACLRQGLVAWVVVGAGKEKYRWRLRTFPLTGVRGVTRFYLPRSGGGGCGLGVGRCRRGCLCGRSARGPGGGHAGQRVQQATEAWAIGLACAEACVL